MRELLMIVLCGVAACGVEDVEDVESGHRSIDIESPDAGVQMSPPTATEACDQLVASDEANCALACSDWQAFAATATVGHCAYAECPMMNGRTFSPSVCLDPKP